MGANHNFELTSLDFRSFLLRAFSATRGQKHAAAHRQPHSLFMLKSALGNYFTMHSGGIRSLAPDGLHPFGMTEAVDIHTALRSYTVWGSRQMFMESPHSSQEACDPAARTRAKRCVHRYCTWTYPVRMTICSACTLWSLWTVPVM